MAFSPRGIQGDFITSELKLSVEVK